MNAQHEMSRVLGALSSTSSCVMVADNNRVIMYMNKAVEKMLREVEVELSKALPHFSVDKIVGSNMDIFHKNPAHQMKLLENLTSTYVGNIMVGKRHFRLVAVPIFPAMVCAWAKWLSGWIAPKSDVNPLVDAAAAGNFSERIKTEGKNGLFLKLAEGFNVLVA